MQIRPTYMPTKSIPGPKPTSIPGPKPNGAMSEIHKRLVAYILAGGSPKEFAIDNGMHPTGVGRHLAGLGIRKVFITDAEHAAIMAARKLAKP